MKRLLSLFLLFPLICLAQTKVPVQLLNPSGSAAGQSIVSNGASVAPTWQAIPLTGIATQAANTVLGNGTATTAAPTALSVPSCSSATNALLWTSGTGFSCNSAINAATLGGATFASPGAIGGTTASTGAFTSLSASGTVSGTGFSTYLASPPAIGGTTANAGSFTTLSSTGAFTPSQTAGIVGTTTNNNANAGSVGEYITATGTSVAFTSGGNVNVASISLTAGDWNVWGQIEYVPSGGATITALVSGISSTSAAMPSAPNRSVLQLSTATTQTSMPPMQRMSLSATTTIYVIGQATWTTGTVAGTGFIAARRVR